MRLQMRERLRAPTRAVAQDPRHRKRRCVVDLELCNSAVSESATDRSPPKHQNPMMRSREASRGLEFEFDRFRHDDGRPRPFLRIERRNEENALG